MVSSAFEDLIYDIKLSTVGPGRVTGQDVVHEPTNMDMAMKLHYLRGVYFFGSEAVRGLTVPDIKRSMFTWLNLFYMTCGRFRRSESGRPFIKCNDCGARIIEAQCTKTLDEWLEMKDHSLDKLLVSNQVIGPELAFSPLVLIQVTFFKCGGMSMGLSWAHVLGDVFSASDFINALGPVVAGHQPTAPPNFMQAHTKIEKSPKPPPLLAREPLSVKRVDPVGDHWITASKCKMETHSFQVPATQLTHLQSKLLGPNRTGSPPLFESLCAIIWQCIAKIREGPEPRTVTLCKNEACSKKNVLPSNGQTINVIKANSRIGNADLSDLAALLLDQTVDERGDIEAAVEMDHGLSDFVMYGANLTFVDLQEVKFYNFELKGQKPVYVSYNIDGVGDQGVVFVLPGPKNCSHGSGEGRIVTVQLPKDEVLGLKSELEREWSIV